MDKIIKPTLILALVAFFCTYALSHIKKVTQPNIERQEKEKLGNALALVLPGFSIKAEKKAALDGKEFLYWKGEKEVEKDGAKTAVRGFAFLTEKPGYSGPVRSMVGVDEQGAIIGISVVQQSETPGLGARSIEIASKETFWQHFFSSEKMTDDVTTPWFQDQFRGLATAKKIEIVKRGQWTPELRDELLQKNAVSAITGATITTRAVRDGIDQGAANLRKALEMENAQKGDDGK